MMLFLSPYFNFKNWYFSQNHIMKKILAFAGSNSKASINQQLLDHVLDRVNGHQITRIKLTNYPLSLFGVDLEKEQGFSENLKEVHRLIREHDVLIIAVNEHNGGPSVFFKNYLDWLSRLQRNFLEGKKILLFSTSPGRRGARSSLEYTKHIFERFGGEVIESFSLPSFKDNFQDVRG